MTNISLAYDPLNRLTNRVDAVGTNVYTYDGAGQLLSEHGPWANDTVSYTYNNRLRMGLSLLQPGAAAWTNGYGYDPARRLTGVASLAGTFGYVYDPVQLQRVDDLTLPNGAFIADSYDAVARLTATWLQNSTNAVFDSYYYGYNQAGQRTNVSRLAGDTVAYTYDNAGELQTAVGKESDGVTPRLQEQFGYAYDAAGNLSWRTNNALVQAFNLNTLNELTTAANSGTLTVAGTTTLPATNVTVNGLAADLNADATFALGGFTVSNGINTFTAIGRDAIGDLGTNTVTVNLPATNNYTYDLNGNLLSDGTRNFAYDDENQLISVWVTNVWQSQFVYDGKLRRRIERDYSWTGSWTETNEVHYIYDGNVVIQERDSNNVVQVSYTRGNDLSGTLQGAGGIGGLLARSDNTQMIIGNPSAHAYYHSDGNGNVTMLINNLQGLAAKYLYDPFGNTLSLSGPLASVNVYRFSSKEWNVNSGLYYYLYRFYDPKPQRWPNRDPLPEEGHRLLRGACLACAYAIKKDVNTYRICDNAPTFQYDPLGLLAEEDCDAQLEQDMKNVAIKGAGCAASATLGGFVGAIGGIITGGVVTIITHNPGAGVIGGVVIGGALEIHDWCEYNKCMNEVNKMKQDADNKYNACMKKVQGK